MCSITIGFQIKWTLNVGTKNKIQNTIIGHILREILENLQAENFINIIHTYT
jgi:hypothetical protein